ncbi:MAG: efflux RND transporter periplasmic adaptor subunit [Clostridiales bacterium]|nr:efflux RND transporter periplasmic adaptor subunit [Clostridiales bacterium]
MKKIIFALVPVVLIGGFFFFKGKSSAAPVEQASIVVEERDIESNIFLNGTVVTEEMRYITANTNDVIESIEVKVGDTVKKGDILAIQNTEALETALKSKMLQLEIEQIRLSKLKVSGDTVLLNGLQSAKLAYNDAKLNVDNDKILFESGVISEHQYNTSVTAFESAKTQYQNAQFNLNASSRETDLLMQVKLVESIENDILQTETKIKKASLSSPIDGTVTDIKGLVGERADGMIMTIANFDKNIIKTNVSEADINKISLGQTVIITANSIKNEAFSGKVSWISPDSKKVEGKKQAYVEIKVALDEVQSVLRRNFSVNLKIQTSSRTGAKVVKFEGLKTKPSGESYVTVMKADGTTEEVIIKTGIEGEVYVEVISDQINIGDEIIIEALPAGYGQESTGLF